MSDYGTHNRFLDSDEGYKPHRPEWNDPYSNFEKIRTIWPSAKQIEAYNAPPPATDLTAHELPPFNTEVLQ